MTPQEIPAFIREAVSIIAASRSAALKPSIARAAGCRLDPSGKRITLFVAAPQAQSFLDGVRQTRSIAVVFSRPSSHRTLQLKASDALVEALLPKDAAGIEAYVDAFVAEVAPLGFSEAFSRALLWAPPTDFVGVTFSPEAAFDQTPGPRAGARLER